MGACEQCCIQVIQIGGSSALGIQIVLYYSTCKIKESLILSDCRKRMQITQ